MHARAARSRVAEKSAHRRANAISAGSIRPHLQPLPIAARALYGESGPTVAGWDEKLLDDAVGRLSAETGLAHRPSTEGEHVSGIYRQRVTLASGRFAMIDDGLGFQLVPWRPALEQQLGRQVAGVMSHAGGVDWSFGRKRGLGI